MKDEDDEDPPPYMSTNSLGYLRSSSDAIPVPSCRVKRLAKRTIPVMLPEVVGRVCVMIHSYNPRSPLGRLGCYGGHAGMIGREQDR